MGYKTTQKQKIPKNLLLFSNKEVTVKQNPSVDLD